MKLRTLILLMVIIIYLVLLLQTDSIQNIRNKKNRMKEFKLGRSSDQNHCIHKHICRSLQSPYKYFLYRMRLCAEFNRATLLKMVSELGLMLELFSLSL